MAVRQHGMVQFTRREDSSLDDSKVDADVGVTRLRDEARMSFGVHAGLVHPRVQGGVVDVMDLLTQGHAMVQFDGIGTTPTEGVTRVERFYESWYLGGDDRSHATNLHEAGDSRDVCHVKPFMWARPVKWQ